jgi:Family of unknown function (DUF5670)
VIANVSLPYRDPHRIGRAKGVFVMLWTLLVVILILWLLGFSFSIGGGLIHLLLVVALVVLLFQLITGRRAV